MNPTPTPQPTNGQIPAGWGNPDNVAAFRAAAMQTGGISPERLDQYISSMQGLYNQQNQNKITAVQGGNQAGGITPGQAQQNPQGALNFLGGGGSILKTGADAQAQILNDSGNAFKKGMGTNGYVTPQTYNAAKGSFVQAGGDASAFDGKFEDNYVNPNNAFYDTPDAKIARASLPIIKNVVNSYAKLNKTGPLWQDLASLPGIGPIAQQTLLSQETAHQQFVMGETGNLRSLAGAGQGQGFRFNLQELNNIAGLLPGAYDTKSVANAKPI